MVSTDFTLCNRLETGETHHVVFSLNLHKRDKRPDTNRMVVILFLRHKIPRHTIRISLRFHIGLRGDEESGSSL
jgi:hypothetical protein